MIKTRQQKRKTRHKRIRARVFGTKERPRLCVYKSNMRLIAQLIDDETGSVIAFASSHAHRKKSAEERIVATAESIAKQAQKEGITKVVFDRGGFAYTGIIKAFAERVRGAGLEF